MFLPLARNKNLVVWDLDCEVLIYDLITDKAFCLNKTSAAVYQACDGRTSFDDLKQKHGFTDDIIFLALDQLIDNNLLEGEKSNYFSGFSRRELIRKVGFTTMVALPMIASVTAPAATMAASAGGLFAACSTSADCSGSAPNCAEGPSPGSPKRCCRGTGTNTFGSGATNNSCNGAVGGFCNSNDYTCLNPGARCCSGSGSVNCTTSNNITTCICTCD